MKIKILTRIALTSILLVFTFSILGVSATWIFADRPPTAKESGIGVDMNGFIFIPEEMPDKEVSLLQRMADILNNNYTTDIITDSRDYLINKTIQV